MSDTLSSPTTDSSSESHKNEGFLKSVWHNLTGNQAHANESSTSKTESSAKEGEAKSKDENESKKASGTGV